MGYVLKLFFCKPWGDFEEVQKNFELNNQFLSFIFGYSKDVFEMWYQDLTDFCSHGSDTLIETHELPIFLQIFYFDLGWLAFDLRHSSQKFYGNAKSILQIYDSNELGCPLYRTMVAVLFSVLCDFPDFLLTEF